MAFLYTRDRNDREPKRLIAELFAVGAVPVVVLSRIVSVTAAGVIGWVLTAVLVASVIEQVLKYLGARLPTRRSRHFNEPIDGMIYGSRVGLGFAFAENIDYLLAGCAGIPMGDPLLSEPGFACSFELALVRGRVTALMHALAMRVAGSMRRCPDPVLARRDRGRARPCPRPTRRRHPVGVTWSRS